MNFYAHIAIASLYTTEITVALGAMIPDLASLIGSGPPRTSDPGILHGYALHFATDRAFHESVAFRTACSTEARQLSGFGVRRGTALAAAHVAIELLLDDALSDDQVTQALFQSTLLAAGSESLASLLHWSSPALMSQFEALRQRLEHWAQVPERTRLKPLVERIDRTLSNRPRLAVRASDRATLQLWADGLPGRCFRLWDGLIEAVVISLGETRWRPDPHLARQLRFRRAPSAEL